MCFSGATSGVTAEELSVPFDSFDVSAKRTYLLHLNVQLAARTNTHTSAVARVGHGNPELVESEATNVTGAGLNLRHGETLLSKCPNVVDSVSLPRLSF